MSERGRRRAWAWAISGGFAAAIFLGVVVPIGWAQDEETATPSPAYDPFTLAQSQGAIPWERHTEVPAEPLPPDSRSLTFDQLQRTSREPKANVYAAQTWAEATHPYAVHRAYAAYTSQKVEESAVEEAARAAGLAGIENVGVEP